MKRLHQEYPVPGVSCLDFDNEDFKDVFYPSDRTGELAMAVRVPSAFKSAGYKIRQWGKAKYSWWILHARRQTAPRFHSRHETQFIDHVLHVLRAADVQARKEDLVTHLDGDRIMVSFLWPLHAKRKLRPKWSWFAARARPER